MFNPWSQLTVNSFVLSVEDLLVNVTQRGGGEEFSKGCKLQTLKVWVDFSRLAYCNVVPYFRLMSVLCDDRCVRSPPNNVIAD